MFNTLFFKYFTDRLLGIPYLAFIFLFFFFLFFSPFFIFNLFFLLDKDVCFQFKQELPAARVMVNHPLRLVYCLGIYKMFFTRAKWWGNLSDLSFSLNSTSLERHSNRFTKKGLHSPSGGCTTAYEEELAA